jgi:hypothetical protein
MPCPYARIVTQAEGRPVQKQERIVRQGGVAKNEEGFLTRLADASVGSE